MLVKWLRTEEGRKALTIGYVVALVVIVIEAIRNYILLFFQYLGFSYHGFGGFGFHVGYLITLFIVIGLLYYLIRKSNW
jgi:hypothetical protein